MKLVVRMSAVDQGLNAQLKNVQKQMGKINAQMLSINRDVNRSGANFKSFASSVGGSTSKLGKALSGLGKSTSKIKNMLGGAFSVSGLAMASVAAIGLSKAISGTIKSSMQAIETQNLFNVSMGDTAVETGKAIDKLTDLYGLDPTNVREAVGSFALLARSMGMSTEQAKTLSMGSYNLGMDLSSLMNVPINQVMHDLKSGLLGQSETVYKYGMDVTEAGIKQEALAQGIEKSVRNMSQGEKMALRYAVMIRTAAISNGDFAKTLAEPANQLRILQERMLTLSRAIGNIFMPMLQAVLPYLNAFAAVAIKVANAISALFGFVAKGDENTFGAGVAQDTADGFEGVADGAGNAASAVKKYKATILGIDELNLMSAPTESSGGGGGGGAGGMGTSMLPEMVLPSYDSLTSGIKTKAAEIQAEIESQLNVFKDLADKGQWEEIGRILAVRLNNLIDSNWASEFGNKLGTFFNNAMRIFVSFISQVDWNGIGGMIATFFNSLIYSIDGAVLGKALTLKFNAIFEMLLGFVQTFDWKSFGIEIYNGINSFITNMDLSTMVDAVSGLFNGLLDLMIIVLDGVDWAGLAQKISDVIGNSLENKDTKELGNKLMNFINSAFGALIEFLGNMDWEAIGVSIGSFIVGMFEKIDFSKIWKIFEKIFMMILDIVKGAFTTIYNALEIWVDKVIQKIAKWFDGIGIKIQAWLDGINGAIWDFFESIRTFIDNVMNGMIIVFSRVWQTIKDIFNGFVTYFKNVFVGAMYIYSKIFTGIFEGISKSVGDIFDGIKSIFSGIIDFITGVFTGNWSKAWNGIVSIFSGIFQTIGGFVTAPINAIIGAINGVIGAMNGLKINIPDWVPFFGGQTLGFNIPEIPFLAQGGIVESSTLANIGEAGAEAVIPLNPTSLSKYFAPILGNNTGDYETTYRAMRDALKDTGADNEGDINLYIDGVFSSTIEQARRKNMRSGKVVVPVGV